MVRKLDVGDRVLRRGLGFLGYTSRFVTTPHGEVNVVSARGEGTLPPIVLLHGLGSRAIDYLPLLRHLRRSSRLVVAPDLLGHGSSASAADGHVVAEVAQALELALEDSLPEPAVVFGNSLGGLLALRFTLDRPKLVRGLYLASPAGAASSSSDEVEQIRRLVTVDSHGAALRFLDTVFHDPAPLRHLLAYNMRRRFRSPTPRAIVSELDLGSPFDPDALASIQAPIRLFWGRGERLFPPSHLEFFRAHLPLHTEIEEAHGFGHAPQLDDAAALGRRIVDFARAVSSSCTS